jgi:TRAP-type C4-dicarboxylate transport system permease small subunit
MGGGVFLVRRSMKLLRRLTAIFDTTVDIASTLGGVLLIFLMLVTCVDVLLRYFLGRPMIWVVEISEIILLYITFLGSAWLLRKEGHVKIEMFSSRLRPKTRAWLDIIISAIGAISCLVVVWYGVQITWDFAHRGIVTPGALELNRAWAIAIIPLGSLLLAVQFLKRGLNILKNTQRN